jgi:hypothetical protein
MMSQDGSVGIAQATDWEAVVRFPAEGRDFPFLHNVQVGSEAHPSYPMGIGISSRAKEAGREADYPSPSCAEVKNGGALPALLICLHGMVLN